MYDQYEINSHKLEWCVCGADEEDKECECGYYEKGGKVNG